VPKLSMLPQKAPQRIAEPVGRAVARAGVTPNMVSVFGFGGNVAAAVLIARGELVWAGLVFLVFSILDLVDGAVARATGQSSAYGAVLDAVLDRASEAIVLVGVAWYFGGREEWVQAGLTYAALVGSVCVSYMRARAEVVGFAMREGLFRRQERVAFLTLGLLFSGWGALKVAVALLAVFTNLTALQRFVMLAKGLRAEDAGRA
jgi:CDP-diacylglycerol---glycerol-3-phosphate 3-phosphatidyltransferase